MKALVSFFQKSLCQALCRLLAQEFNLTRSRLTLSASIRSGVASTSETFNDFTFFTSRLFSLFLSLLNYIIFFMKTHFIMLSRLESLVRRKRFSVWDIREGYALIIIFYYSWEAAAHLGFHHRKRVGKVFFYIHSSPSGQPPSHFKTTLSTFFTSSAIKRSVA